MREVGGDLLYHSLREATIDTGATIGGTVSMVKPVVNERSVTSIMRSFVSFWRLVSLFGLFVVGLIVLAVIPKTALRITDRMKMRPWPSLGWGAVAFIVTPIVALLLVLFFIRKKLNEFSEKKAPKDQPRIDMWKQHTFKVTNFILHGAAVPGDCGAVCGVVALPVRSVCWRVPS